MSGPSGRGPAPVLPAMGLYSFHNDSPPFSGATELPGDQPEVMNLDSSRHSSSSANGSGSNGMLSPSSEAALLNFNPYQPHPGAGPSNYETNRVNVRAGGPGAPISGKNSPPTGQIWEKDSRKSPAALAQRYPSQEGGLKLDGQMQVPVSPAGKPPQSQHVGEDSVRDAHDKGTSGLADEADLAESQIKGDVPPTDMFRRVSTSRDDVERSNQRSRRLVSGYLFGVPQSGSSSSMKRSSSSDVDTETQRRMSHSEEQPTPTLRASSPTGTQSTPTPTTTESTRLAASRRPALSTHASAGSSNRYIDDAGMSYEDNLRGVNDGEADADDSAPKAKNGGSGAYMRKEGGEYGDYMFPTHRLRKSMKDESKIPLVIVACGSFSPPTYLHLRMFEMAKDELVESQTFEIMAGYYSPVSSYYKKAGLAPAIDRVRMCELAVEHTSTWLMVDPWEAGQSEYQRTAVVLDHFDEMLNGVEGQGGVEMLNGERRKYKVMLLAGGDLIESFGEPGVWSEPDLHVILGRFGCLIVERAGSDVWAFLLSHDILYHHRRNVIVIKQLIYNDISSTKVRLFVRRGMSIKYLLPNMVIQYIEQNKLYLEADNRAAHAS